MDIFGIHLISFGLSALHPGKVFFGWRNHIAVIGGNGREDAGWKSGHGESHEAIALVFPIQKHSMHQMPSWKLAFEDDFPFPKVGYVGSPIRS